MLKTQVNRNETEVSDAGDIFLQTLCPDLYECILYSRQSREDATLATFLGELNLDEEYIKNDLILSGEDCVYSYGDNGKYTTVKKGMSSILFTFVQDSIKY